MKNEGAMGPGSGGVALGRFALYLFRRLRDGVALCSRDSGPLRDSPHMAMLGVIALGSGRSFVRSRSCEPGRGTPALDGIDRKKRLYA